MASHRLNAPRFVDETVDGEALIMDMVTGAYYTCFGASTTAWEALKRGAEPPQVAAALAAAYPVELPEAEQDVERFLAELTQEEMLVPADGPSNGATAEPAAGNGGPAGEYQPLAFERYTDLADLILLDPVHDVSDAGWPHTPQ